MRNLKRALSLTLASVMLLGMMVIGTSAASFTDADQITNVTAATVLQELEVMQGSNGKFSPNQTVTRGQMAILICKMLYGSKLNAENFAGTSEFTDVPANAYYTGYVNLASQLGIISGYGNGKFGPGAPVTTAQAALMLTRALGWFQAGELENQNWTSNAIAAVEKATSVKLFGNLKLGNNDPLSRDNVAEMVFNALTKTAPVNYNERWDMYYSDEGSIMDGVKFNYLNSLGYKNFTLVYNTSEDDFGRPATEWGIGNGRLTSDNIDDHGDIISATIRTSILKAADEADLTYTKDVKISDIYKDLGKPSLETSGDDRNTVTYKVDDKPATDSEGAAVNVGNFDSSNDGKVGFKGATTEVYKDKDNDIKIVTINTYLVEASADYSERNGELSVTPAGSLRLTNSNKIKNEDVTVSQFKKDDLILVTGVIDSNNKLEIKTAELAPLVENVKVSAYNNGKAKDYVTAGGTKYEYNVNAQYDPDGAIDNYSLQNTTYTLVLDKAGYVIGAKKYSDEVTLDDILFVKDAAKNGFIYQVKAVFMDGREETITVAKTATYNGDYEDVSQVNDGTDSKPATGTQLTTDGHLTANRFYEFNKKSNGEYELKDIVGTRQSKASVSTSDTASAAVKLIDGDSVRPLHNKSVNNSANSNTIFIADGTLYTGIKNAPDVTIAKDGSGDAYYLLDTNANYLLAVWTDKSGVSVSSNSDYVYVLEAKGTGRDENDKTYNVYNVIKEDGTQDKNYFAKGSVTPGLYEIRSSEDGYPKLETARKITADNTDVWEYESSVSSTAFDYKSDVVTAGSAGFKTNEDTKVIAIDANDDKEVDNYGNGNVVKSLDVGTYSVCGVYVSKNDQTVKTLWVVRTSSVPATSSNPSTEDINKMFAANDEVTVPNGVTLPGSTAVGADKTLTVGTSTAGGSVDLNGGTLNAPNGGTLPKLDANPTGTIQIGSGDKTTRLPSKTGVTDTYGLEALADAVSANKAAPTTGTASGKTTTYTVNITAADRTLKTTGTGYFTSYSGTAKIPTICGWFGTTDNTLSYKVITLPALGDGQSAASNGVRVEFFDLDGNKINVGTDTGMYGCGATGSNYPGGDDKDILLPIATNVGSIKISIAVS